MQKVHKNGIIQLLAKALSHEKEEKEVSNKANFEDLNEIFRAIIQSGGKKASACYTPGRNIQPCLLFMTGNGDMRIDNLPTSGYSHSAIREEYLNQSIFLLKHLPVDYARAVFWNTEKPITYVDLQNMDEYHAHIVSWEDHGYYCIFKVKLECDENAREFLVSGYGKDWVFLDPEN